MVAVFWPAEFNRIKRVPSGLLNSDISSDRRDGDDPDFWGTESHDESDGIIRGNVGVDQEGARHPRRITNQYRESDIAMNPG
jgi:hypothetical protein